MHALKAIKEIQIVKKGFKKMAHFRTFYTTMVKNITREYSPRCEYSQQCKYPPLVKYYAYIQQEAIKNTKILFKITTNKAEQFLFKYFFFRTKVSKTYMCIHEKKIA